MENEHLPTMRLTIDGERFESTPDNTSLFQYIGASATRSHIFIETGEGNEDHTVRGSYIFSINPAYQQMLHFMAHHNFPMHVNLREVADCDERAYQLAIDQAAEAANQSFDDELKGLFE
ncbi:MAG TPA: hypothetical protein VFL85_01675 [Candidatus Saccharimonadales bacterium]|nr:hypothetical protein [Candidatus Saccharimonadales bacterium]